MVRIVRQNLWDVNCTFRGITTNGQFRPVSKEAIMGTGAAKEALEKYPTINIALGRLLQRYGNHVFLLVSYSIFTFPTKHHWQQNSNINLIQQSVGELVILATQTKDIFAMPLPGTGSGNLKPIEVWPLLWELPDNVVIAIPPKRNLV